MKIQLNRSLLATVVGAVLALGAAGASQAREQPRGHAEQDARTAKEQRKEREDKDRKAQAAVANARAEAQADVRARAELNARANAQREQANARVALQARAQAEARARADRDSRERIESARVQAERQRAEERARNLAEARRDADRRDVRQVNPRPGERAVQQSPTHRAIAPQAGVPYGQVVSAERHRRNDERRDDRRDDRNERIARERGRQDGYRTYLAQRQREAYQRTLQLQRTNRVSQYRYMQTYYDRLRQMQLRDSRYNWSNDPYFNSAPSYRYYRAGNYYQVNQYSADLLRQAVRLGYQEGYQAGRADSQDGWRYSYRDSFAYQDANYGYRGYYVSREEYNHYFREGFQRGYEDGYRRTSQYGRNDNGNMSLLETVLSVVLNMRSL